jgi:hypothetical protein
VYRAPLLITGVLLLAACGSDNSVAPIECGDDLATDDELALTPREDANLEALALVTTGRVVASQESYDRVIQDVAALRLARPDLREIGFRPALGQGLVVRADEITMSKIAAGSYEAWDCLNRRFRVVDMTVGTDIMGAPDRVRLKFDGVYDVPLLAERYAGLPDIEDASEEILVGDGSTLCLTPGESTWHYVVDQGSGDCPAGCIDHDYHYFVSTAEGMVTPSGSWTSRSGEPAPPWVTDYVNAAACHGSSVPEN